MADEAFLPGGSPRSRIAHAIGGLLAIAGLAFVGSRLWSLRHSIATFNPSPADAVVFVACVAVYALAGALLGQAWRLLLEWHGGTLTPAAAHEVYGRSQIGKYVPGNVAQVLGRQALGVARGIPARALGLSAVHEVAALVAAAAVLALPTVVVLGEASPLGLATVSAATVAAVILHVVLSRMSAGAGPVPGRHRIRLLGAHALHLAFFALMGVLTVVVAFMISGWLGVAVALEIAGSASLAWIAGYLTPGAPAGLGVREAVLVGLLGRHAVADTPEAAVLVAGIMRLVTMAGDAAFFASARPGRGRIGAG